MKAWNVISGVASTLFVASILTFGLSTEIASAHGNHNDPCTGPHKNESGCGGGGGGDAETTYTVNMKVTNASTNVDTDWCTGTADKRLGPIFESGSCMVELNDGFYGLHTCCLLGTEVRNTNKGTKVMLFMARDCDPSSDSNYHTLQLVGELVLDPGEEAPDFHIVVTQPENGTGVVLTKIHQPNKDRPLTDKIIIEDIVYTVDQ